MKFKLIMLAIVITVVGFIMLQNMDFYLSEETLTLNLYFAQVRLPAIPNITHFLVFFFTGILFASLSLSKDRVKSRKEIKKLSSAFNACAERVTSLKRNGKAKPERSLFRLPARFKKKDKDLPQLSEEPLLNKA